MPVELQCITRLLIIISYLIRLSLLPLLVCILYKCICSKSSTNPGGAAGPSAFFGSGNGDLLQPSGSLGIGKGLLCGMMKCWGIRNDRHNTTTTAGEAFRFRRCYLIRRCGFPVKGRKFICRSRWLAGWLSPRAAPPLMLSNHK